MELKHLRNRFHQTHTQTIMQKIFQMAPISAILFGWWIGLERCVQLTGMKYFARSILKIFDSWKTKHWINKYLTSTTKRFLFLLLLSFSVVSISSSLSDRNVPLRRFRPFPFPASLLFSTTEFGGLPVMPFSLQIERKLNQTCATLPLTSLCLNPPNRTRSSY